jgi:hypothetical protein
MIANPATLEVVEQGVHVRVLGIAFNLPSGMGEEQLIQFMLY